MVRISDIELVKMLRANGRASFSELAKRLGVSEAAVRKKVKKLEDQGTITGYAAIVHPHHLGFEIDALIGVDTTPEGYMSVREALKSMEEVMELHSATGDHMLMASCWCETSEELGRFIRKIESMSGVTKVCPAIILEKLK